MWFFWTNEKWLSIARKEFCNSKLYKKCRNELNVQKYILRNLDKHNTEDITATKEKIDELKKIMKLWQERSEYANTKIYS